MYPIEKVPTGKFDASVFQTMILDVNNDCLLKILRYLNVEDMAAASDTCHRLRDLTSEAFKYEWKGKPVFLSSETKQKKLESTAILRNFGSQMQKINIDFGDKFNNYFLGMIIEKCSSSQLIEVDVPSEIFSRQIILRLKNKFTNLRVLAVENTSNETDQLKHISENFPTLEDFRLYGSPFENQNVVEFITMNPQLKSLSLLYRNDIYNSKNLLQSVDQHLIQLEQLELEWMPRFVDEAQYQPIFFKNLKRLKMFSFGTGINMQYLSISNENVEELELEEGTYNSAVTDFICHYKKLRKVAVRFIDYPFDFKELMRLSDNLPKLTELEISSRCKNINYKDIIHIILGSKQLVKFSITEAKIDNISEVMKDLQRKLDLSKWSVGFNISNKQLVIKKLRN